MIAASVLDVATVVVAVWLLAFIATGVLFFVAYVVETRRDAQLAEWRAAHAARSAETRAVRAARPAGGVSEVLPLRRAERGG